MFNILLQAKKALTKIRLFARIILRSLSITVSTSGFHPDNAGSTPAEITSGVVLSLDKNTPLFVYILRERT